MLEQLRLLYEKIDCYDINGLDFQNISICKRRCWLYLNRISLANWNEHIRSGLVRHSLSHTRDNSTSGLMGLKPDRIDWKNCEVIEEKFSESHLEASQNQLAFYVILLSVATGQLWQGKINLSRGKKRISTIVLNKETIARIRFYLEEIIKLKNEQNIPDVAMISACKGCSFSPLCWIGEGEK